MGMSALNYRHVFDAEVARRAAAAQRNEALIRARRLLFTATLVASREKVDTALALIKFAEEIRVGGPIQETNESVEVV